MKIYKPSIIYIGLKIANMRLFRKVIDENKS